MGASDSTKEDPMKTFSMTRWAGTAAMMAACAVLAGAGAAQADEARPAGYDLEVARAEAERARAEAERARAEAERARLEVERIRAGGTTTGVTTEVAGPKPGSRTHDGLFLRLTAGYGYGGFGGSGSVKVPGTTGAVASAPSDHGDRFNGAFQIGGTVAPNLILHADLWGSGVGPRKRGDRYSELALGSIALGMTYYVMPWNLFVTGSVGPATSVYVQHDATQDDHTKATTADLGTGIGVRATVGKEWWVSDNWALGVALQGDFAHTRGDDANFTVGGGTVLFTATFN